MDLVSCPGWPAALAPVLSKVLEGHCGYSALRRLLLPELAVSRLSWQGALPEETVAALAGAGQEDTSTCLGAQQEAAARTER